MRGNRALTRLLAGILACGVMMPAGLAIDTPSSTGEAATVDIPILRIPFARKTPNIDGVMEEGEWEDAAALSALWYDRAQAKFYFLAPHQTNLQVYVAYDKDNLYIAYSSPVYPENSWLKARGRFPDVTSHPLYGLQWDDHVEIELRPYHDRVLGFRLGLFKLYVNPINTIVDWFWSQQYGTGKAFQSKMKVRCGVTRKRWIIECAFPLNRFLYKNYIREIGGKPIVSLPPADGTAYLCWFTRGIGGNGGFFNVFDNHCWNTTKTKLIFDSQAPSFQINELGPIMDDIIDVRMTVKNHSPKSQTVRLGFFVESADGTIYSSYDSPKLKDGMLELRPGEVKKLRLQQIFPGISMNGNVLWFDVRAAGRPAKVLFRTRLIEFHAMDGGYYHGREKTFKEMRLDVISELRPPRKDFDFWYNYSEYANRVSAVVDIGVHGTTESAKRAREAKLIVMESATEEVVLEKKAPLKGKFACFLVDLPKLKKDMDYKVGVLLFDQNKRIVGEQYAEDDFSTVALPWKGNKLGLSDVVWEPFTPIRKQAKGFETLKHRFTLAPSGLPEKLFIKPDIRDLPLEKRGADVKLSNAELLEVGRGQQLKAPFKLITVVGNKRFEAKARRKASLVRQWQSEFEYKSRFKVGPLDVEMNSQYDCDGSMHVTMTYGSARGVKLDGFEMLTTIQGLSDLAAWGPNSGMAGAQRWDCRLPGGEGIVWDSASQMEKPELFYSRFVPWLWFGSADRAFTWYADSDRGWMLDKEGSSMTLERDRAGDITWRVKFINHPVEVKGKRTIKFSILTHPAKPKPKNFRQLAWFYRGDRWARLYAHTPLDFPAAGLQRELRTATRSLAPGKSWTRYGFWTSIAAVTKESRVTGAFKEKGYELGGKKGTRNWQDAIAYYCGRWISQGKWAGFWWDEYWPLVRSEDIAGGYAYLRDPAKVGERELPWQAGYMTSGMRITNKRLARIAKENNVPQRHNYWANNEATLLESFGWDCMLVEECGATNRTFEIDTIVQYPNSLVRYEAKNWSGLICRVVPDAIQGQSGDDQRLDRQYFGRALLNDIGVSPNGPHGTFLHFNIPLHLFKELKQFGFFEDRNIEKIPFWRNRGFVRYGDIEVNKEKAKAAEQVYVTVYRRPLTNGKGYKALFVILNEGDKPLQLPLTMMNPERILGGPNTLTAGQVRAGGEAPAELADWWAQLATRGKAKRVLRDIETGEIVSRLEGKAETYGPVFVPKRNYRVLYGEYQPK